MCEIEPTSDFGPIFQQNMLQHKLILIGSITHLHIGAHSEKFQYLAAKNAVAMELKFQFIFYTRGRYNACVMHHQMDTFCVFI